MTQSTQPLITINDALQALNDNISTLKKDEDYTLEELVGKPQWQATHKGHRNQLGAEFKQMCISQNLPVRWYDRRSDNIQVYRLK